MIAESFAFLMYLGGARKLPSDFDPATCKEQR